MSLISNDVRWGSAEVLVAFAPDDAYRWLLTNTTQIRGWQLLRRLGAVLLVISVLVPIMAVQRVTPSLVVSAAVSWSFVVVIQLLLGTCLIASAPRRQVGWLRGLDLWFAGNLPYNLFMLVVFAWMGTSTSHDLSLLIASAIVPAVWTAFIATAFCRRVLGTSPAGGRWRATMHFVAVWTIGLSYTAWAAGGWFQLLP